MGLSIFHGFFWRRRKAVSAPGAITVGFTVTGSGTATQAPRRRGGRFRNLPSWPRPIHKSGSGSIVVGFAVTGSGVARRQGDSAIAFATEVTGAGTKAAVGLAPSQFATALTGRGTGDHFTERRQRMEDELLLAGVL